MKRIAIDYIEALRPDAEGNDMIVVIVDCFSRFICLYPVKSKGTEVFLHSYLQWLGMGFGNTVEILVDRGSQFTSRLTSELAAAVGQKMIFTTAGSKQENAIVERANREVMRHLRNIIMDKRSIDEWGKNVPLVQRIMNSMVHSSTGVRPSSIIYSEEIDPSIVRSIESTLNDKTEGTGIDEPENQGSELPEWEDVWIDRLKTTQQRYIERAVESLTEMDRKRRESYPKETSNFEIGALVLSEQGSSFRRGPESKLLPLLAGPFEVIKVKDDIYTVKNGITGKLRDIHLSKLHPYTLNEENMTQESAAITDYTEMYLIEKTVSEQKSNKIKGKVKLRDLKFLVKWVGYPEEHNTWQTWGTLRKSPQFRTFLETHKKKEYNRFVKELPTLDDEEEERVED
jgi:hypothetical protein